jgi:hypothetical protein
VKGSRFGCAVGGAALLSLLLVARPTPSRAAPGVELPGPSEPDVLTAELEAAVAAYEAGDLERARTGFEAVHAIAPSARTYRSLALVAFRQSRFEDAVALLDMSLASDVKPLGATMRRDAESLRAEAAAELAASRMEPVRPAPALAPPEVAAVGASDVAKRPESPREMPAPPRESTASADSTARAPSHAWLTGSLLALGGAGLLLSATSAIVAQVRVARAENDCGQRPAGGCDPGELARLSREAHLTRLSRLASAGLVVGGTGLGLGGVSLYLDLRARRSALAMGLQLAGTF